MNRKLNRRREWASPAEPPPGLEIDSVERLRELEARAEHDAILRGADREAGGDLAIGGPVSPEDIVTMGDPESVDEIGEALGVYLSPDAELRTSAEILGDRDQHYWDLERKAARDLPASPRGPRGTSSRMGGS